MTEEQAKVILEAEIVHHPECSIFGEALSIAIQAIDSHIPRQVAHAKQHKYGAAWKCPTCEAVQIPVEFITENGTEPAEKHSYCWYCGQKIDWGNED